MLIYLGSISHLSSNLTKLSPLKHLHPRPAHFLADLHLELHHPLRVVGVFSPQQDDLFAVWEQVRGDDIPELLLELKAYPPFPPAASLNLSCFSDCSSPC